MPGKIMVRCDIEGVSGVVSYDQAEPGKPEYAFGLRMFESDLRALLDGLVEGGADEIVIYDEHYYGRNIDPAWLPPCATAICGKPPYRADWAGGLDASFDGLVLLGFHSKFGTPGGLLHHSYELDIRDLRLDGLSVGEIGMETAIAGDCGAPLVLVTGDSAGVAEAKALVEGAPGVVVKHSLGETGGEALPLSTTSRQIREAAHIAAANPAMAKPLALGDDLTLDIELNDGLYLDAVRRLYGSDMTDDRTLALKGGNATALWSEYWQRKLRAQEAMR